MSAFETLVEDYATTPVPDAATYSGWRIGFVLGGVGIALPALYSGAEVGQALGLVESSLAFLVAGVLVTLLASVSGWVGMRSRLSTYMILKFAFGQRGADLVNLTFALAQFGWFGVNAYFFGTAAEQIGEQALGLTWPSQAYVVLGGVLMVLATIFGYKALDKLALLAFPLLVTVLTVMVSRTFAGDAVDGLLQIEGTGALSFAQAVTVLAGGIIVGVLLIPDLTRYARRGIDVFVAVIIALTFVETLVHVAAAAPALRFGETEPLGMLLALGFGAFALGFLIFASLSTNVVNLYGSGLALSAIEPRLPEWGYVALAGTVGTILALFEIGDWFIDFLIWQSVIFSAVLGVYVVDFFFVRGQRYALEALASGPSFVWQAFAAWALGAAVAAASFLEVFSLTGMANLDGVLVAGLLYAGLSRTLTVSAR